MTQANDDTKQHTIKLLALSQFAKAPTRNDSRDVCADLYATHDLLVQPGDSAVMLDFGIVVHPDDHDKLSELQVHIRSSMAARHKLSLTNSVGIIEPHYSGYALPGGDFAGIMALLSLPANAEPVRICRGMRVCQLRATSANGRLIRPDYEIVDRPDVSDYELARSGFGSTGA